MADVIKDLELLSELNDEKVKLMIPVIVYVSLLMILGSLGNILVCVYYRCKTRSSTNSFFIIALAIFDLLVCLITMPIEIIDLRFFYIFTNIPACKISRFLNHFAADGSAITLLAIAVDRYRRLCCPLKTQLEISHARKTIFLAVILAIFLSWPAAIFYQPVTVNVTNPRNRSLFLHGSDCTTTKNDKYKVYLWIFNIVQFVIYIFATTAIIILYSLAGRAIYRYKRRRLKYASIRIITREYRNCAGTDCSLGERKTYTSEYCNENGSVPDSEETTIQTIESKLEKGMSANISSSERELNISKDQKRKCTKLPISVSNKATASKPVYKTDRTPDVSTVKCTILMLVITIFYIVGYLPYLVLVIWRIFQKSYEGDILSDAGLVGFNIGIRSYLINSAVNPILYGFFNDNFRKFFCATFFLYCAKKEETSSN